MKNRKNTHHGPASFVKKLFKILKDPNFESIISWTENGTSFVIKDQHLFTNLVLPQYYKHQNFASFVRQLNMYDFHKVSESSIEFMHPLFQRKYSALLKEIRRKSAESTLNKDNMQKLTERIQKFQSQQSQMENILISLEKQYDNIVEQNQILIDELIKSKQREMTVRKLLSNFRDERIQSLDRLQVFEEKAEDFEDYGKLSPL